MLRLYMTLCVLRKGSSARHDLCQRFDTSKATLSRNLSHVLPIIYNKVGSEDCASQT
jgi:hypothetical protein